MTIRAVLKTVGRGNSFVGSNPTPAAASWLKSACLSHASPMNLCRCQVGLTHEIAHSPVHAANRQSHTRSRARRRLTASQLRLIRSRLWRFAARPEAEAGGDLARRGNRLRGWSISETSRRSVNSLTLRRLILDLARDRYPRDGNDGTRRCQTRGDADQGPQTPATPNNYPGREGLERSLSEEARQVRRALDEFSARRATLGVAAEHRCLGTSRQFAVELP